MPETTDTVATNVIPAIRLTWLPAHYLCLTQMKVQKLLAAPQIPMKPPSRTLPNLLKAKYTTKTRKTLTESIKNQPVLVDT